MPSHALSIRLPEALYQQAADLARRRKTSLNALVQEQLQRTVDLELYQQLILSADLLGEHAADYDVSYADEAQAEQALAVRYDG